MFDFRLKVFYVVAHRLNFTKAAGELFITQPAVSKHIHEIESYYKTKLFERNGTKIKLTKAAKVLLEHTERLMDIYRKIDIELAALSDTAKGALRIGASTTVASYFLPKHLASFRNKFPDISLSLTAHNTEHIENMLSDDKIDLGIVEGESRRQNIKYMPVANDELVLCARSGNNHLRKPLITTADLKKVSLVIREPGSGSREVILSALKTAGLYYADLNIDIELENTESIKSYIMSADSFAFLSRYSVAHEVQAGRLKIIGIKDLSIERSFFAVTKIGDSQRLTELFMKSMRSDNLRL